MNQLKQNIKRFTVEDTLQFTKNASYVKDSFRVTKGEMSYVDGEWHLIILRMYNEHPVTSVGENGQSFICESWGESNVETDQYHYYA